MAASHGLEQGVSGTAGHPAQVQKTPALPCPESRRRPHRQDPSWQRDEGAQWSRACDGTLPGCAKPCPGLLFFPGGPSFICFHF